MHSEHGVDGNSLLNFVVFAELLPRPELSRMSNLWPNFFCSSSMMPQSAMHRVITLVWITEVLLEESFIAALAAPRKETRGAQQTSLQVKA